MMEWAEHKEGLVFAAVTLLLLLLTILGQAPGLSTSIVLLVVGVVLFGLPHGALDPLVARRVLGTNSMTGLLFFLLGYAFVAAVYGLVWWWSAPVGLATFLGISAYHFGTDWGQRGSLLTRCAYGLAIVTLPVLRHASDTQHIYAVLSPASAQRIVQFSQSIAIPAALATSVAAVAHWRVRRRDVFEFVCILIGALFLQPILYFSCYFCFLHSPRHLFETARDQGLTSISTIARAAAPATLAPVLLACIFYSRTASRGLNESLLQITFIGLAILTVPHMILQAIAHTGNQQLKLRLHSQQR